MRRQLLWCLPWLHKQEKKENESWKLGVERMLHDLEVFVSKFILLKFRIFGNPFFNKGKQPKVNRAKLSWLLGSYFSASKWLRRWRRVWVWFNLTTCHQSKMSCNFTPPGFKFTWRIILITRLTPYIHNVEFLFLS